MTEDNRSNNPDEAIVAEVDADLEPIIPQFFETRAADVEALRKALSVGDFESARFIGHNMKGAGGGYGFEGISDIGKELEAAAKAKDAAAIKMYLTQLIDYLKRVRIVYV